MSPLAASQVTTPSKLTASGMDHAIAAPAPSMAHNDPFPTLPELDTILLIIPSTTSRALFSARLPEVLSQITYTDHMITTT